MSHYMKCAKIAQQNKVAQTKTVEEQPQQGHWPLGVRKGLQSHL